MNFDKPKMHKLIPYLLAGVITFTFINTFKVSLKNFDFSGLFNYGNAIALAGLFLAWQSTKITEDSAQEAKEKALFDRFDEINKDCEERDRLLKLASDTRDEKHEERFSEIDVKLVAIETQIEIKKATYQELIAEIFSLRKELYEYKAQLAVATRLGEIVVRIDKIQSDVNSVKVREFKALSGVDLS